MVVHSHIVGGGELDGGGAGSSGSCLCGELKLYKHHVVTKSHS